MLESENTDKTTRGDVKRVLDKLYKANDYTYTAADVAKILQENKAKGLAPINLVAERARLEEQMTAAQEEGNAALVEQYVFYFVVIVLIDFAFFLCFHRTFISQWLTNALLKKQTTQTDFKHS